MGNYSAWLSKNKGDGARARWMSGSGKRFFTIDFDSQLFYYSHTADRKKISNPVRFKEVLHAEQLPQPAQTPKNANEFSFGFSVRTPSRTYDLFTITYLDAKHWVDALMAGRDIANGMAPVNNTSAEALQNGMKAPQSSSTSSLSTAADGSCSSASSEHDRDFFHYGGYSAGSAGAAPARGPQPWQPPVTQPPVARSAQPWQPPVAQSPAAYSGHGTPYNGAGSGGLGGAPSGGYGSSSAANAPASAPSRPTQSGLLMPVAFEAPEATPEEIDPFAALDALEEMAGPVIEQTPFNPSAASQKNIQGALLREARAMLTNKSAKPSAAAAEALQRLKNPAPRETLGDVVAEDVPAAQAPKAVEAPIAPLSQNVLPDGWSEHVDPNSGNVYFHCAATGETTWTRPVPAPAPVPAPVQCRRAAPAPAAVQAAITKHNPSAQSWDSDDDADSPKKDLLANQAMTQFAPAPLAMTPQRQQAAAIKTSGRAQRSKAASQQAPTTLSADDSGWDSDDGVQQAAPAHLHHQLSAGAQLGVEASDWDSDDDASAVQSSKARVAMTPMQPLSTCGAPMQPTQAFVAAKTRPAAASSTQSSGNDLDDLLGEVLDTTASVRRDGSASHGLVPGFHCTKCDFQVLRINNNIWGDAVEYMFFRNNYPNVQKLRPQTVPRKDCCAYCCQCSWKSAESAAPLADVAEGLRWRSVAF